MMLDRLTTKLLVASLGMVLVTGAWLRLDAMVDDDVPLARPNPAVEHWQSKQGAEVLFIATHELPMVDLTLLLPAGSAFDANCPGVANFTAGMLDEGAADQDADAIAVAFESVGAAFSAGAGLDSVSVHLRTLRDPDYFDPAVKLLHQVLTEPNFPEPSMERMRNNLLRSYDIMAQQPGFTAQRTYLQALYGDQPYGHGALGSKACLNAVTRDRLQGFYKQHFLANHGVLAIVGDLTTMEAKSLADMVLQGLPKGDVPALTVSNQTMRAGRQHVDFPSTQTTVLMGQVAIARDDPDYFPLLVGSHILGGGMNSRLFKTVREASGLAYHISSGFSPALFPGSFTMMFSTRNDQASEALSQTQKVFADFMANGVTEEELRSAKRYLSRSYVFSLASNSGLAEALANMGFYHLPLDFLHTYPDKINAVTLEGISASFHKHLNANHMAIVTVGGSEAHAAK